MHRNNTWCLSGVFVVLVLLALVLSPLVEGIFHPDQVVDAAAEDAVTPGRVFFLRALALSPSTAARKQLMVAERNRSLCIKALLTHIVFFIPFFGPALQMPCPCCWG
jgi:hypothetical protein